MALDPQVRERYMTDQKHSSVQARADDMRVLGLGLSVMEEKHVGDSLTKQDRKALNNFVKIASKEARQQAQQLLDNYRRKPKHRDRMKVSGS